jgi:hypothetical protein
VIQADLDELRIPEKELDDLSGIALSDGFAADFYRSAAFRDSKKLFSFLLNELLIFCMTLSRSARKKPNYIKISKHREYIY